MSPVFDYGLYGGLVWGYSWPFPTASAHWIWNAPYGNQPNYIIPFIRVYYVSGSSRVKVTINLCVDNYGVVFVNGKRVGGSVQATAYFEPGKNTIEIDATNLGPSGDNFAGLLFSAVDASGTVLLVSDSSWSFGCPSNLVYGDGENTAMCAISGNERMLFYYLRHSL